MRESFSSPLFLLFLWLASLATFAPVPLSRDEEERVTLSLSRSLKRERMKHARAKHARRIVFCVRQRKQKKKKKSKRRRIFHLPLSTTPVVDERLPMASASKTSWLRRFSRLSVIAAGATAGIGVALWLLPEEEDGEYDDGFFVKDASSSPFGRSGAGFDGDGDDDDDEDLMFRRRQRRHQRPTFASEPLHPPSQPSFLAQLTVRVSVL